MTDFGSPGQADLIREGIASALLDLHVASPGIVQSYDDATQTCSVQPAVRRPVPLEDGTVIFEDCPVLANVPVLVFGSPALSVQADLAAGDSVLLLYLDFSPVAWRGSGVASDPHDVRQSGPAYPVAIPWHRPKGKGAADEASTMGASGGVRFKFTMATIEAGAGSDFVAMAAKVDARIAALEAYVTSHTHPVPGVTPGPGATVSSPPAVPPTPGGPSASVNLKAD